MAVRIRSMSTKQPPIKVAISVSDSPDLAALGLSEGHLKEIMAELAIQLLAADADLAYGGDLRAYGFSRLLFQLVLRYTALEDLRTAKRVTNHLAWPVHIKTPVEEIDALKDEFQGAAEICLLARDGARLAMKDRRSLPTRKPTKAEWDSGLTAMRKVQCDATDARVLLGGQVKGYMGRMPGIAEEALVSLQAGQPLFLIGGFGGCTRDVAEALGLLEPCSRSRTDWVGMREFKGLDVPDLKNGLTAEENQMLAGTPFIGQAVLLVLSGIHRLRKHSQKQPS